MYICIYIRMHLPTPLHTPTCTYTFANIYTPTHTYTHLHTPTCIHTYIHIYILNTDAQTPFPLARMSGYVEEENWTDIVKYMYNTEDSLELIIIIKVCMYVCVCVCVNVCVFVCVCGCMYECMYDTFTSTYTLCLYVYLLHKMSVYVCVHVLTLIY